jgi:N-methylhydantoinase A
VHEARAAEIVRALWPNRYVTAGHAVVAEYREYERGTTAAVNAAIQPVLHRYIERLQSELARRGFARDLLVMQGNGGTVSSRIVAEHAVATVMSGPASGVIAAAATALQAGRTPGEFGNVVTYDMGGTSSDVALVLGGQPTISSDLELEYAMPIHVPMIDVHTIGAGGGSIASVDASGMLKVGPESAGATPGPICYGRGGTRPTITDANLALGRLDPDALLAVEHAVSLEQVRAALLEQVGKPLGLDAIAAAAAILRIANDRMAGAIRMVSLSRGHDPRDFALFAFGGAGPLHAARARARARHPARPDPGAAGADERPRLPRRRPAPRFRRDRQPAARGRSRRAASPRSLPSRWRAARRSWRARTSPVERVVCLHRADMQFQGQSHILPVPIDSPAITLESLRALFAAAYHRRFGVELPEIRPVLVNLHTAVIGRRKPVELRSIAPSAPKATLDEARRHRATGVVRGRRLARHTRSTCASTCPPTPASPARRSSSSSTARPSSRPGDRVEVDPIGNLIVSV